VTDSTPATQLDVLLAITRLEGKLDGALSQQAEHGSRLNEQRAELTGLRDKVVALETQRRSTPSELTGLRDKVVALETQRRSTPSWTASVPALVAVVTLLLILAREWYGSP
jgi:predicted  nucleic acid-binding Zn-ribbon protein